MAGNNHFTHYMFQIVGAVIYSVLVAAFSVFLGLFLGNRIVVITLLSVFSFVAVSVIALFVSTEPLLPFPLVMKDDAVTPDPKEEDDISYCSLCDLEVKRSSKHCRTCNQCVEGFDHHCRVMVAKFSQPRVL